MTADPASLGREVWDRLHPEDREWLRSLAREAGPGARVALVGGAVRDALLGGTPLDLDVAVEGADTGALAAASGLPALVHPAFGNATVTLPDGRQADLVRTRRETYPVPGANPLPLPGTLEDDLARRDFGLNALGLEVPPEEAPQLLDVTGGLADLRARVLRPLHSRSLHEDASRLVRGARLAGRLGLEAHPELRRQVLGALGMAEQTPRLWAELGLLVREPRPGRAARVLEGWGAGRLLPAGAAERLEALDTRRDAGEEVSPTTYAAALLSAAPDPATWVGRLGLGGKPGALLARALGDAPTSPGSPEATLRALLRPDAYAGLSGRDVVARGVPPGPAVGAALAHLAALRRAGAVGSRAEEEAALTAYLARQEPTPSPG
ncbi:tRNA nucleotidyltransferase (CCA-adding enzyme) [Deinococcus sp. HSC-46F16]|uniref:CCA tRNA nucleotidyltransferase n=1 Tax=Deinococcus sp. HSC-46F16 TaxID=2910968 RepID=UPI00209C7606|nr:CCA tRNA nucleotidyltransferase [Deinococcus sp. HSC-46F16]MCP2013796.1 tRNA nucleotidyltransferase (CCA-adding enzyme) [Deinococcus sp. HSC-46F16]